MCIVQGHARSPVDPPCKIHDICTVCIAQENASSPDNSDANALPSSQSGSWSGYVQPCQTRTVYIWCILQGGTRTSRHDDRLYKHPPPCKIRHRYAVCIYYILQAGNAYSVLLSVGSVYCKGEVKIGPDWSSPPTTHMGGYCRGLTAHCYSQVPALCVMNHVP